MRALTVKEILAWADAYHDAIGQWPKSSSGRIAGTLFETWAGVDNALRLGRRNLSKGSSLPQLLTEQGGRGLPGRSSLPWLLAQHRQVRNPYTLPPLEVEQILAWADAHYQRTGDWPTHLAGPVPEAPGETWAAINAALYRGQRGQPGG